MSSLTEFYRPEHLRPVDAEGFELPEWLNPYFQIPDQIEPSPINDALFAAEVGDWFDTKPEPTEADHAWLNKNPTLPPISGGAPEPFVPTAADWADYEAFCREVDERHEMARMERLEDEARARYG